MLIAHASAAAALCPAPTCAPLLPAAANPLPVPCAKPLPSAAGLLPTFAPVTWPSLPTPVTSALAAPTSPMLTECLPPALPTPLSVPCAPLTCPAVPRLPPPLPMPLGLLPAHAMTVTRLPSVPRVPTPPTPATSVPAPTALQMMSRCCPPVPRVSCHSHHPRPRLQWPTPLLPSRPASPSSRHPSEFAKAAAACVRLGGGCFRCFEEV